MFWPRVMATGPVRTEVLGLALSVAVLAKAPVPGHAKTRLAGALGPVGAARLHRQLVPRGLSTVRQAGLPLDLWCEPLAHRFFRALARQFGCFTLAQPAGDIAVRMHAAFAYHAQRSQAPLLLIGADCPVLEPAHLQEAGRRLWAGDEAVFIPAEDGGYVLVGLGRPVPELFEGMAWSTEQVMAQTRFRLQGLGLRYSELPMLWDIDRPTGCTGRPCSRCAGACYQPSSAWANSRALKVSRSSSFSPTPTK